MTTVYTIYAGECPIYQNTSYERAKQLWSDIVASVAIANPDKSYTFKKGEELMFEHKGGM